MPLSRTGLYNLSVSGESVRLVNAKKKDDRIFLASACPSRQDDSVIKLGVTAVTLSPAASGVEHAEQR